MHITILHSVTYNIPSTLCTSKLFHPHTKHLQAISFPHKASPSYCIPTQSTSQSLHHPHKAPPSHCITHTKHLPATASPTQSTSHHPKKGVIIQRRLLPPLIHLSLTINLPTRGNISEASFLLMAPIFQRVLFIYLDKDFLGLKLVLPLRVWDEQYDLLSVLKPSSGAYVLLVSCCFGSLLSALF